MITTALFAEAKNKARGMTAEEIREALDSFSHHMCVGTEVHPVKVRIGWRSQITSIQILCGETP